MPSARDCADRLREQAYKTLMPQIQDLEEELQKVGSLLSTEIRKIEHKIEALRHTELPATELVLDELLGDAIRKRDLEGNALSLFARTLRSKETQEEILTLLLDSAANYCPRVALFAVRGDRFVGWSSRGFDEASARRISSDSFPQSECPQFLEALEDETREAVPKFSDLESLHLIAEDSQGPWRLFPLRVLQRPVAILIAGEANGIACRPEAVSILMDCTALRLENIALKILYALSPAKPETIYQAAPEPAFVAPKPFIQSEMTRKQEPEVEQQKEPEPEYVPEFLEPQSAVEPMSDWESGPAESEPLFGGEPAQEANSSSYIVEEQVSDFSAFETQPILPAAEPKPAAMALPEEEKLHSDAKRFARLLVSEIKLYNERHVIEGRKNGDLYLRLKKDIDRSREMYDKRVSTSVTRKIDYFHDEIVRILGDNNTSTLGSDYPGPRIES